ncbi:integrin alpha-2 [Aplochiton taeniatus]
MMDLKQKNTILAFIFFHNLCGPWCLCFNVGSSGAKIFTGPQVEEFGYTVRQFSNHQGKWLLVGSPWSGYIPNRKGDVYKCEIQGPSSDCQRLNLQESVSISTVRNINVNMSLGLTLTRTGTDGGFLTCGPLWAQKCGNQYYYPGVCAEVSPLFKPLPAFAPALQTCGGPMDIAVVLDGSNSIFPWEPVPAFLKKLLENLDIGPHSSQVSIIQYGEDPKVEFSLNSYTTKEAIVAAAAKIPQKYGLETNTFHAIEFARANAFLPKNGGRPGATKVMVVVTDGESHDKSLRDDVIGKCQQEGITRFAIAVLGYYNRNNQDTNSLIAEIKSIANEPSERYFFNVSDEAALQEIAGALGDRIFNIEGTGKGGEFNMELSQVGFSAHQTKTKNIMLGAVGAYAWSGTVVHYTPQKSDIFPKTAFESTLQDRNDSSLLGYTVTTLYDGAVEYFVAGAPRSNHTGLVVVYLLNSRGQPNVVDSQRGDQIGSYYGSVLCPLDVDRDGKSDLLLVGAPMFMNSQKKEAGKVYVLSFTKGVLSDQAVLEGPSPGENARFGMAMAAAPDLNMDGYSDVVVGAPLEDEGRGVVYVFNGDKRTIRTKFSQRIWGSKLDSGLKYFGRSLDASTDLNDDTIPDVTVGGYGKVVQLWSRGVAVVMTKVTFDPANINILSKTCRFGGRTVSCFKAKVCLSAKFTPSPPVGPLALRYNLTLDADLQSSRVTSRGQFNNTDRLLLGDVSVTATEHCDTHHVFVQDAPDFISPLSLRVDVVLQDPEASPVLDLLSHTAWEFFIPFTKDCGTDDVCESDLTLSVKRGKENPSSSKMLVSFKDKRLSYIVTVRNRKENSYNSRVTTSYSANLFYASVTASTDGTEVKCASTPDESRLSCVVGYPALLLNQEVTFTLNFDVNLNQHPLLGETKVDFEALSDSTEANPSDNTVSLSVPVQYDSEISVSRESIPGFLVVDIDTVAKTTVNTFDDIGPEFNFTLKVSTGNFPVSLSYLTVFLPSSTSTGNPLIYVTGVSTSPSSDVTCNVTNLIDPLEISKHPYTPSFRTENLLSKDKLDCKSAKCHPMKCVLKDMKTKSEFYVNVTSRIWNGTFAAAVYQSLELTVSSEIESSQPDLLLISHKHLTVGLTITKPGVKGEVPVGVIVGSIIGGLLLLALLSFTLWKLGFFKRKYQQLQKNGEAGEEAEMEGLEQHAA